MKEYRLFESPEYLQECKVAISWLRHEMIVYHDPDTPDFTDPIGIVNATISRLNKLTLAVRS